MGCQTSKTSQKPQKKIQNQSHISQRSQIKKVHTYDKVKSKICFHGNDMEAQNIGNTEKWVPTQAIEIQDRRQFNREEDYALQNFNASKSHLKSQKQILTYDIDTDDGVSKTPQINTFQYQSILQHNLAVGSIEQSKVNSKILNARINQSKLKRTQNVNTSKVGYY